MIKRLRMKLVTASMTSLIVVLLVIESAVGLLNYGKIVEEADRILEILQENNGKFPPKFPEKKRKTNHLCRRNCRMNPDIFLSC